MTFPIDFYEHPKVAPLSDAAFRAFVEMNGYSRRHDLDGHIPVNAARLKWKARALAELVASHPDRPLVVLVGDEYVIRDYADHQFTAGDLDKLRERRSQAGAKGAAKRWHKDGKRMAEGWQVPSQNDGKTWPESESESESGTKTDVTHLPEVSPVGDVVADSTDSGVMSLARFAGIRNLEQVYAAMSECCGNLTARGAVELTKAICARSKHPVENVDAYVLTVCRDTPDEVRWDYDRLDLGVIA